MKGYVGDKEATDAILDSQGWLKTGDLCYISNQGYLFFVDRLKELIKYKGYQVIVTLEYIYLCCLLMMMMMMMITLYNQVAPAELEHLLHSHPNIIDAAVIP